MLTPPALADDPWNPFGDRDRSAARSRSTPTPPADRGGYLAPMTPADRDRIAPGRFPRGGAPNATPTGKSELWPPPPYPASPVSPFDSRPGTYQPPSADGSWATGDASGGAVIERGELSPISTYKASNADSLWAGLDPRTAEQLLAPVGLPPASPAMSDLLKRLLLAPVAEPRLELVRASALWRSGTGAALSQSPLVNLANAATDRDASAALAALLLTKIDIAAGRQRDACARIKVTVSRARDEVPAALRGEAVAFAGYCAIAAGNPQAGTLAAELARDAGYNRPFTIALLEAVSGGGSPNVPLTGQATLIDGLLALSTPQVETGLLERLIASATPGLLGFLTQSNRLPAALSLAAGEQAAARNIITPARLAEIYRAHGHGAGAAAGTSPPNERAALFAAAESTPAQFQKTRAIRSLLDRARRDGLYHAVAAALTPLAGSIRPAQEISWFSETAVETLAAGGDYAAARNWVTFSRPFERGAGNLDHWLMLLDIADAELSPDRRGEGFRALEDLAAHGRFAPDALHRLATVLDALDYNVPISLWDLASRTPQPQTGHLPETGILSALKAASEKEQRIATGLLALRTISPNGTSATHLLGLSETIRALKRAGFAKEARRLAFEAVFSDWPRTAVR